MDPRQYQKMLKHQELHWWFKARRNILATIIKKFCPQSKDILEIGAGTGANIEMLQKFGHLTAIEPNSYARSEITKKFQKNITILDGKLPDDLNLDKKFDLICLFDVLEHVKEDLKSLESLKQHLKPNGKLIVTIPAFQFLFSQHDTNLHHFRRYNKTQIEELLTKSNYKIEFTSYFNFLLFPLALISRILLKIFPSKKTQDGQPPKIINYFWYQIFNFEKFLLKSKIRFPFGLSIITIATHKN